MSLFINAECEAPVSGARIRGSVFARHTILDDNPRISSLGMYITRVSF